MEDATVAAAVAHSNVSVELSSIWLPLVVEHIASFLHPNEVACGLRLANKTAAAQLRGRRHTTIHLSQPSLPAAFAAKWGAPGAMRALVLPTRVSLLRLTAASGSIPNLEAAVAYTGCTLTSRVLDAAAAAGQLEVCRWLLQRGVAASAGTLDAAAGAGYTAVCELLLDSRVPNSVHCWSMTAVCAAARAGHAELMEWLLERRPEGPLAQHFSDQPYTGCTVYDLLAAAAQGCSLEVLQSLHERIGGWHAWPHRRQALPPDLHVGDLPGPRATLGSAAERVIAGAVRSRRAEGWRAKVEWLEARGFPVSAAACEAAASVRPPAAALERLAWLRARGCPADMRAARVAMWLGDAAVLEHVLAEGALQRGPDAGTVRHVAGSAAALGQVAALRALRAHGCPMDALDIVRDGAYGGHVPVLEWAVEALGVGPQELQWGDVADAAAASGSVAVMAWLHERGCRWSARSFRRAVRGSCSEEALEWLVAHGCPMGDDGNAYLQAALNGDLLALRCLQRLGCPWGQRGQVFTRALALQCSLAVLRCLLEAGCPVDWVATLAAAERQGSAAEVRAWLAEQREHVGPQGPSLQSVTEAGERLPGRRHVGCARYECWGWLSGFLGIVRDTRK